MELSTWDLFARLGSAAVLGGIVGLEREFQQKAAGLRTNMMVALGAAAFTLATIGLLQESPVADVARIIQGVATGIGFLGAGSIVRSGGKTEGLTTAAGIWVVGAVGIACGIGAYTVALSTAAISIFVLFVVGWLEIRLLHKQRRSDESGTP